MNTKTIATRTTNAAARIISVALLMFLTMAALCVIAGMIQGIVDIATGHNPVAAANAGPLGCWNEPNPQMPGGYELLQGQTTSAPVGSVIADCPTR